MSRALGTWPGAHCLGSQGRAGRTGEEESPALGLCGEEGGRDQRVDPTPQRAWKLEPKAERSLGLKLSPPTPRRLMRCHFLGCCQVGGGVNFQFSVRATNQFNCFNYNFVMF